MLEWGAFQRCLAHAGQHLSIWRADIPLEFFADSIVNPNAVIDHDAKERGYLGDGGTSNMPDYGDALTMKQLADLASYLAGLKNEGGHTLTSKRFRSVTSKPFGITSSRT
ncbi:MAG: exported protein of unknown function [Deltaproteobacteria bacterium]|nr:exported protein of unknown function [Deltaproteobacteria bacterium]